MTRAPTFAAIIAAELRLTKSRRNVQQSVERTRSALRAAIARPSTLVLVAVASGISAFMLTSRHRPAVKSEPSRAESTIKTTSRSLLRTFVSMYGARLFTLAIQLGATAGKKSGPSVNINTSSSSAKGATATPEHP